jgi:phage-related protein
VTDVSLHYLLYGQDVSASKSVTGVATTGQKTAGIVSKAFGSMGNAIGGEVGQIMTDISSKLDELGEHSLTMGEKLTAGGAAITGVGGALTAFSQKDEAAQKQLEAAVGATGKSYSDFSGQIGETVDKMADFNHGAADTKDALRILTQSTNDPAKALSNMSLVANLAAARHESLADAASSVARILGGNGGRTLTEYGITLQTTGNKTKDNEAALAALAVKLNGQAAAAVDSFGGKFDVLKTKISNVTEEIGEKAGPALTALGPVLMIVGTAMQIMAARNEAAAAAAAVETTAVEGQTVATEASSVASKAMTAAQWLLNAALDANPIAIVVIAIAALVAALVIAYKNSKTFRDIVQGAFKDVETAGKDMWDSIKTVCAGIGRAFDTVQGAVGDVISFIRDHWKLILSILTGPFGALTIYVATHFSTIVGYVKDLPGRIENLAGGMLHAGESLIKSLLSGLGNAGGEVDGVASSIVNAIIDDINEYAIDPLKNFGFSVFHHSIHPFSSIPDIPHFATGGIITRPTVGLIGEAGPEAVIPLSRLQTGSGGSGDARGITINITTGPMTTDGARELDRALRKLFSDSGGSLGIAP